MKFKVILLIDEGGYDYKEDHIGEMTAHEIEAFKKLLQDQEETMDEGYMFDGFRYSIASRTFYLYLT